MANKTFKQLFNESKKRDAYWVEKAKIEFAEELFKLMERREVNKTNLAERFGSSPAYITKALCGDVNFTIETMVKFVRALNGKIHIHLSGVEDGCRWIDVISGATPIQRSALPKGNFQPVRETTVNARQLVTGRNNAQSSAAA